MTSVPQIAKLEYHIGKAQNDEDNRLFHVNCMYESVRSLELYVKSLEDSILAISKQLVEMREPLL